MNEAYLSAIVLWAANFAPRGWAYCNGQLLSISQNTALFSLLGTTYGGDGQTTFALPDFRGRVPVGAGQGPGLTNVTLGEMAGSSNVTLLVTQMPAHTHTASLTVTVSASSAVGTTSTPAAATNTLAGLTDPSTGNSINGYNNAAPDVQLNIGGGTLNGAIGVTGGGQPVPIMQPFLGINMIIALEGIFPSRP